MSDVIKIDIGVGEIARLIAEKVEAARKQPIKERLLTVLEVIQTGMTALRREREQILSELRGCDLGDRAAVARLASRVGVYLDERRIFPSIDGGRARLEEMLPIFSDEKSGIRFRKRDRSSALGSLESLVRELGSNLQRLFNTFSPNASALGIQTLPPIRDLLDEVEGRLKRPVAVSPLEAEKFEDRRSVLWEAAVGDEAVPMWAELEARIGAVSERLRWALQL